MNFRSLWLLSLFLLAPQASAGFGGVFGLGPESMATAGTSLGWGRSSGYLAFEQPAALGQLSGPDIALGILRVDVDLLPFGRVIINESGTFGNFDTSGVLSGRGQTLGLAIPLGKRERPLGLGVAAYLSADSMSRVSGPPVNNPYYPVYQDVTRNAFYTFAAGYRIWQGLSLGLGVNTSLVSVADYRLVNSAGASFSASTVEVKSVLSPTFAALYDFSFSESGAADALGLKVGLQRRGKSELKTKLIANLDVQGVPVLGELTSFPHFSPAEWVLSLAWAQRVEEFKSLSGRGLSLSAEIARVEWSDYRNPFGNGNVNSFIFGGGSIASGLKDIWVPRLGINYGWLQDRSWLKALTLRAGYSYQPTPVPNQTAGTNFADSNRHLISLGVGGLLPHPWQSAEQRIRIDLFAQYNRLEQRNVAKARSTEIGAPGYRVGGSIWAYGLGVGVPF